MKNKIPFEYWLPAIYMLFGALWILFSDELVLRITSDPKQIVSISTYKGWFFVLVTGILLSLFIRKELRKKKQLYNQLLEVSRKATESDRLKTAFLSNLSHYIRTPMNSILGFVDLLKDQGLDSEKRHLFLTFIDQRSHHLLQTLNNIIDISKVQEQQMKINYHSFSVNEMIVALSKWSQVEIHRKKKDIKLETHFARGTGADILFSDHDKVYHILSHLLSNAINFTEYGVVELGYSMEGSVFVFYVRDTGSGIPKENQDTLFNAFMTSNYTVQIPNEGTGLGLYLSFMLTQLLGGRLWLEYSSLQGSGFSLALSDRRTPVTFS